MWVDVDVEEVLYTCPVLSYTPFVEEVFAWFQLTYTVEVGMGWVRWTRSALPYDGGIAQQSAKMIEALEFVAQVRNSVLTREMKKRTPKQSNG